MKILTLYGTRPEQIKLSSIMKKLDKYTQHIMVHTGQNHDYELNEIFYNDLGLRKPDYFLNVVGKTFGETIGNIMSKTEEVLLKERPDAVVILGDTNSALGGYIAKRMKIPIFHLEAGNRCFDPNVPEEINRGILDHLADVNMVYCENSRRYLLAEGVAKERIFVMGSPMAEVFLDCYKAIEKSDVLSRLSLKEKEYFVASIHRDENTEIKENLDKLVVALNTLAEKYDKSIVLSTHPRLQKKIEQHDIKFDPRVKVLKPFGFADYITLQRNALCVLSDSGTISEESAILGFPAVTIRNAIERPEAIDVGSIVMTGTDPSNVLTCVELVLSHFNPEHCPVDYQVTNTSERVLRVILGYTGYINKYIWHKR
jgi:UDP-N-acetylglucosamine 2-epimerase (non-hydrolysing)